jgi:hypothetical protein
MTPRLIDHGRLKHRNVAEINECVDLQPPVVVLNRGLCSAPAEEFLDELTVSGVSLSLSD